MAKELVKDYTVTALKDGTAVWSRTISGNYQRQNIIDLETAVIADQINIHITATNGDEDARVFEVRVY